MRVNFDKKEYDVFVSHASEDKELIVRPLVEALESRGINVWYDENNLRLGDSLRRKIDQGLVKSRFGIIVLSKDFINKSWTNYELDGLIIKAVLDQQVIIPIWHNMTIKDVAEYSPFLADKFGISTSNKDIDVIADEIVNIIL